MTTRLSKTVENAPCLLPEDNRQRRKPGGWALAVLCLGGLAACGDNGEATSLSPLEQLEAKIADDAILLMDREGFSSTFDKLGEDQFDRANEFTRWAAVAAAESDQCDDVTLVGVSDHATRRQIQWYVDCANRERFQITQEQAEAARVKYDPAASDEDRTEAAEIAVAEPKSARWKDFNERIALSNCQTLVRSSLLDQGSFDTAWSWDSEKDDKTGLVVIQQDFEAGNAFGGTISSRYDCVVDADNGSQVKELSIREPDGWRKLL